MRVHSLTVGPMALFKLSSGAVQYHKYVLSFFLSLLANLTKRREILSSDFKTSFSII